MRGEQLRPHIIFCIMSIISVVLQDITLKIGDPMLFLIPVQTIILFWRLLHSDVIMTSDLTYE